MNPKLKEFIKKIVPINILRRGRSILDKRIINDMSNDEIASFNSKDFPYGINLIGPFSQDSGLGQSCRLVAQSIKESGVPYSFINYSIVNNVVGSNKEFENEYSNEYKYGINLFHINMHEFFRAYKQLDKSIFNNHYNIAYWLWENEEFPEGWIGMINVLDEIWTPAEFVTEALKKVTGKPVYTFPYIVEAPYDDQYDRKYFNLPEDKFLYLMLFDNNSISERKNPFGVIDAFKEAFDKNDNNVGLVIKISNADGKLLNNINSLLDGYNVYYVNQMLSKVEVNSLIKDVDVYVSLHRAEGFGLVLAEAMCLKTPTIATNYSANTEFQNKDNTCLVDYELVEIGKDIFPYQKQFVWADPNIKTASEYMKKLYNDADYRNQISENGFQSMHNSIMINEVKTKYRKRIKEIYESH